MFQKYALFYLLRRYPRLHQGILTVDQRLLDAMLLKTAYNLPAGF